MTRGSLCRGAMLTIIGVLIGALLAVWLWEHEPSESALAALDGRAVGLQAGVLAGDTATVRWPSWTPMPTNTPRVYPSWTPLPTRTPRWTATPTRTTTPTWTATVSVDATLTETATMPPTPTLPAHGCEEPWPFTQEERLRIQAATLNRLWREGRREEPQTLPQEDAILSIGLYALDLGAPLTDELALLPDGGPHAGRIRVRGFALGIVALMERDDIDMTCRNWAVISWGGEATEQ